jgi:DNA-binding transcriptional regulator YiaG
MPNWPPAAIQALRQQLGESTAQFGERFGKSGRTIEGWEQGRRVPDVLAQRELTKIAKRNLSKIVSKIAKGYLP